MVERNTDDDARVAEAIDAGDPPTEPTLVRELQRQLAEARFFIALLVHVAGGEVRIPDSAVLKVPRGGAINIYEDVERGCRVVRLEMTEGPRPS